MTSRGASAIDWPRQTCSTTSRRPSKPRRLATSTVCLEGQLNRRSGFHRGLAVYAIQREKTAVLLCWLWSDF